MNRPLTNFQTRDAEALLHPYTDAVALRATGALVIERGEGVRVWDQSGRSYIDGLAGLWCCGLGFGNAELVEAARMQMEKLPYYHLFAARSHEPGVELAEKIKELAPGRMARVFYQSSGSEANDTQIKFAWYMNNALGRPAKKKIISRAEGLPWRHHRRRLADRPAQQPPRLRPAARHRPPHRDPALLERRPTGRDRGRLRPPPRRRARRPDRGRGPRDRRRLHRRAGDGRRRRHRAARGLFRGVNAVCRRHDVLMISDEVICGFGRTGQWFGAQALGYRAERPLDRQAADRRLPAALGRGDRRAAWPRRSRRTPARSAPSATATPTAATRSPAPSRSRRSRSTSASTCRPASAALAPRFAAHLDRLAGHPLVGEARASRPDGRRSSSPRTARRPASPSPARSAPERRRS